MRHGIEKKNKLYFAQVTNVIFSNSSDSYLSTVYVDFFIYHLMVIVFFFSDYD